MLNIENFDDQTYFPFDRDYSRLCSAWIASAVMGGAAVLGAATQIYTSNKAANTQKEATDKAVALQQQQYQQTRTDLAPYRQIGVDANADLQQRLPVLTSPINMDQATLEQTPGYQFTKTQGLKATQNAAAARGLGISGAALKGAATFATSLADNTYKTQFDIENTNRTNAFNRLKSLIDTGAGAAAGTGAVGSTAATNAGQATIAGGNAQAAGLVGAGNAVGNLSNNVAGYAMYNSLYGKNAAATGSGDPFRTNLPNPNGGGFAVGY